MSVQLLLPHSLFFRDELEDARAKVYHKPSIFLLRLWERRALKRSRLDFENLGELGVSLILPTFSQKALEDKL